MDWAREILAADTLCPAAGQGALAIEIRVGDLALGQHLAFLDDFFARTATACERALLNKLGGGCQVPIGALRSSATGDCILRRLWPARWHEAVA